MTVARAFRNEPFERLPQHFFGNVTEDGLGTLVKESDALLFIDRDDSICGSLENAVEPRLRKLQRGLISRALRDLNRQLLILASDGLSEARADAHKDCQNGP